MNESKPKLFNMVLAAMLLAFALLLPFLTGQLRQFGRAFCLMHIPVLLCGFFCGPWYGLLVGLIAPLLRFALFGQPVLIPFGVSMSLELATYGLVSGLLYAKLPKKKSNIYVSLICAMFVGRVIWGISRVVFYGLGKEPFGWAAFITGGFVEAVPGIILQIIVIPLLVMALNKYNEQSQY